MPGRAGWGPPLLRLPPSAIRGAMSPLHVAPVAPFRGARRCWTGFGSRGQQFSRFSIQVESLCFLFQMLRFRTTFVVQFVPGLLTTLLSSENTPGIDYGALAKILGSVEAEEDTS